MAERTFDYEKISETYKNMQKITGSASEPDTIAGSLHTADEEYKKKVGMIEEALYGDLAQKLLSNWNNVSSSFPNFVANFNNWANLVGKSAGSYSEFETKIRTASDERIASAVAPTNPSSSESSVTANSTTTEST